MVLQVFKATEAGYCFGVRDAVDLALQAADDAKSAGARLYAYGPIIHNDHVVQRLETRGVKIIDSLRDVAATGLNEPPPRIIIRAHGITKEDLAYAAERGFVMIDATCPLVTRPQELAAQFSREGYAVLCVGDRDHPEIRGVLSYVDGRKAAIQTPEELDTLVDWPPTRKVALVPQTTLQREDLAKVAAAAIMRFAEVRVINTICRATKDRQDAAHELATKVEAMVVIGGKHSANSRHLADICREQGVKTFHIADPSEVAGLDLQGIQAIGVTAGASTPDDLIDATIQKLSS